MNYQDIEKLASLKESNNLEFKESTGQLDRSMETLCAFLNCEGGTILYGVKDNGKIIGQEVSDNTKRSIAEAVNRIEPFVELEISYVPILETDKYVIAIHAECQRFMREMPEKHWFVSKVYLGVRKNRSQLILFDSRLRSRWTW